MGSEIYHIVLLHGKPGVDPAKMKEICDEILSLKDKCLHPTTKQPYIKSFIAGKDISIEGFQNGITHSLISIFANQQDRDYYVNEDPAHVDFVAKAKSEMLGVYLDNIQVSDFVIGQF